ncbi:MAG: bifunctional methylenetetrahydrofolate dehydrogenase/methenyltetrahydrofolate cyclohydrolase FolD [Bacteroidales bacterium]|nr:bifunctional methylenetetrahydrofolate dehydrogenase/methenyltetrahydrofolate cyclohydrolase FolD [Bacteroidales bacterium]
MAQIIDGKAIAAGLYEQMAAEVEKYAEQHGRRPGLYVIIVGEDPASLVYVRNKEIAAKKVGMVSEVIRMPESTTQEELLEVIARLNADDTVDGILVQLPVPRQIDKDAVIAAVAPEKDVDGFFGMKSGFTMKKGYVAPCTPRACIHLIKTTGTEIEGKHALVIGRGELVGKPVATLLLNENATVTIAHSRTRNLKEIALTADIIIAAVGKAHLVTGDMVKPGAVVIDVGINRNEEGKLCGDVDFATASERAGFITPVPGGVGPMTIAMLIRNTLDCYLARVNKR